MALQDYTEEYRVNCRYKNAVFCIYQEENTTGTHVNRTLKILQESLRKEETEEKHISKAFVYGNKTTCVREFSDTESDTIYYMDFIDYSRETISISKVWFMGLVLLEKKDKEDRRRGIIPENVLYLIVSADRDINRVEENIMTCVSRFQELEFTPILVKADRNIKLGKIEEFISEKGNVFSESDLL